MNSLEYKEYIQQYKRILQEEKNLKIQDVSKHRFYQTFLLIDHENNIQQIHKIYNLKYFDLIGKSEMKNICLDNLKYWQQITKKQKIPGLLKIKEIN